ERVEVMGRAVEPGDLAAVQVKMRVPLAGPVGQPGMFGGEAEAGTLQEQVPARDAVGLQPGGGGGAAGRQVDGRAVVMRRGLRAMAMRAVVVAVQRDAVGGGDDEAHAAAEDQ